VGTEHDKHERKKVVFRQRFVPDRFFLPMPYNADSDFLQPSARHDIHLRLQSFNEHTGTLFLAADVCDAGLSKHRLVPQAAEGSVQAPGVGQTRQAKLINWYMNHTKSPDDMLDAVYFRAAFFPDQH